MPAAPSFLWHFDPCRFPVAENQGGRCQGRTTEEHVSRRPGSRSNFSREIARVCLFLFFGHRFSTGSAISLVYSGLPPLRKKAALPTVEHEGPVSWKPEGQKLPLSLWTLGSPALQLTRSGSKLKPPFFGPGSLHPTPVSGVGLGAHWVQQFSTLGAWA